MINRRSTDQQINRSTDQQINRSTDQQINRSADQQIRDNRRSTNQHYDSPARGVFARLSSSEYSDSDQHFSYSEESSLSSSETYA
jgi:hypothetical protein